jgi:hypothetical protein
VENHYLAQLLALGLPYQATYFKSYVPLCATIERFINDKVLYLYFYDLERVQQTGAQIGLMETLFEELNLSAFLHRFETNLEKGLSTLALVDYQALPHNAKSQPQRSDHFVACVGQSERTMLLLDDTPIRELEVGHETFVKAYGGRSISFIPAEGVGDGIKDRCLEGLKSDIARTEPLIDSQLISGESLGYLRDALGIIRISRQRINAFLDWSCGSTSHAGELLLEVTKRLDHLSSLVEAYRLRNKAKLDVIVSNIADIDVIDRKWKAILRGSA